MTRLIELSIHLQSQLKKANLNMKREILRAVVQRIELGPTNVAVVLRLATGNGIRLSEPIAVKLSRA
jgi:hypothetical protein